MPAQRSKTTCNPCRARKVRCDGGPSPCVNCKRLNFDCSFDEMPSSTPASAPERRRGARACSQCRSLKSKCNGELPICSGCRDSGKTCVYPQPRRVPRRQDAPGSTTQKPIVSPVLTLETPESASASLLASGTSPGSSRHEAPASCPSTTAVSRVDTTEDHELPPRGDRAQLVKDFFRLIHPLPGYAFLYEEAVVQRCLEESLDSALMYSICAITALLLGYKKYYPAMTETWANRVENMVWANLEEPTIFRIQALALIVHYRIVTGKFRRGFLTFSLAARSASALRLMYERPNMPYRVQDLRRRLMWSLVMLDGHFAIGLAECELCPLEAIYLQLPGSEEELVAGHRSDPANPLVSLDGVSEAGLLTRAVEQMKIRRNLMRYKREFQLATKPFDQIRVIVEDIAGTLKLLQTQPYSTAELHRYAISRWISRYVTVHLAWHQCHCDTYRLFLAGYKESAAEVIIEALPAEYVASSVATCLFHARAIISILQDVDKLNPKLQVADTDLAVCGYHASRILLHISKSPHNPPTDGVTFEDALELAQSTLRIIKNLQISTYAIVQVLIKEMDTVIQAAITGQDQGSRESSDADEDAGSLPSRYARVAKKWQGLGAHSIFKHAQFTDDSAMAAQRSGIIGAAESNPPTAVPQPQMDAGSQWQGFAANPPGFLFGVGDFQADPATGEGMTMLPQNAFDTGSFGPDPWQSWPEEGAGSNVWETGNYY